MYTLGIVFGLIVLIVPDLLALSRWSLMAPLVMLEGSSAGDARARSRELVRPFTWAVCGTLVLVWVGTGVLTEVPWRIASHWVDELAILFGFIVAGRALKRRSRRMS